MRVTGTFIKTYLYLNVLKMQILINGVNKKPLKIQSRFNFVKSKGSGAHRALRGRAGQQSLTGQILPTTRFHHPQAKNDFTPLNSWENR